MKSVWKRLIKKGNPMSWPPAEAAMLVCAMLIVMYLFFVLIGLNSLLMPEVAYYVVAEQLYLFIIFSFVTVLLWGVVMLYSLRVSRSDPYSIKPGLVINYLFCHPLVVLAYFNGVHSLVTGLLLAVFPAFGFVLFRSRHVFNVLLIAWGEVILLAFVVSFGWLPDAPLYGDAPPNRFLTPMWIFVQVVLGFPVTMGFLLFIRYIIRSLRRRESQLRDVARRDFLTGIWNRGYIAEIMEREASLAERNNWPLSLVVVDLDFFKLINDRYGHSTGDKALIQIASLLKASLRKVDYLGRYGGEEFVLLLPNCDRKEALNVAERCRRAIENSELDTDGVRFRLTASFGAATMTGVKIDADTLFRYADRALYRAKDAGRNCVKAAPPFRKK